MRVVVDANVSVSALIADSATRELIVTLDPELLTPDTVRAEVDSYRGLIADKSGLSAARIERLIEILFRHVSVQPVEACVSEMDTATEALGEVDPDDVPYLACALAFDAAVWSDDNDFREQSLVSHYTTEEVTVRFDTRE